MPRLGYSLGEKLGLKGVVLFFVPQNEKGDVVRNKKSGHPKGRDPVGSAHVRSGLIHSGQRNGREQIQRSFHLEHPKKRPAAPMSGGNGWHCKQRKNGREQVAVGSPDMRTLKGCRRR